jgi:aspartate kinase
MQEMAEAGAKVLNAQAVEFATAKGIAIYARATRASPLEGDGSSSGTIVRQFAPRPPGVVAGVASERDILVLRAAEPADGVLALLDERGVVGKQLQRVALGSTRDELTLVISRENLHDEDRLRRELSAADAAADLIDGLGAVSVIGAGINATWANVRRATACLTENGCRSFATSTSSFRITWLVARASVDDAARVLHRVFIEQVPA